MVGQSIEDLIGSRLAQAIVETLAEIVDEAVIIALLEDVDFLDDGLLHRCTVDANVFHLCEQPHAHFFLVFDVAGFHAVQFLKLLAGGASKTREVLLVQIYHKCSIFVSLCEREGLEHALGQRTSWVSARVGRLVLLYRRGIPLLQRLGNAEELLVFFFAVG